MANSQDENDFVVEMDALLLKWNERGMDTKDLAMCLERVFMTFISIHAPDKEVFDGIFDTIAERRDEAWTMFAAQRENAKHLARVN